MLNLYCDNELIGTYSNKDSMVLDLVELMLSGIYQEFEIINIPPIP